MNMEPTHKQPTRLQNIRCAYCNANLTSANRDKEHVIGRRFVPKGKLNRQWNLILNACSECNGKKSDLENDISAITMVQGFVDVEQHDPLLRAEAARRSANTISRRTKRSVAQSEETFEFSTNFGNSTMRFGFSSNPQIDEVRAFELARYHLAAFFYYLTYDSDNDRGYYWLGEYMPVFLGSKSNWGNPIVKSFAEETKHWNYRLAANTAEGYFKVIIKKHPKEDVWSWALEWNNTMRLIGFLGGIEIAQEIVNRFPQNDMATVQSNSGETIGFRAETPLSKDEDDLLFFVKELDG